MTSEVDAVGRVAEIHEEIKSSLGTDFVPNLYKVMAVVDLFSGFNNLLEGLQVEPDEQPWYG